MVEHPAFNRVVPSSTLGRGKPASVGAKPPGASAEILKRRATVWWTLTIIVAAVFLLLSLSDSVYNLTSPPGPFQILLRKSYSVVAFAIVGYLFSRALSAIDRPKSLLYVATSVALYSAVIEIVQAIVGAREGLILNAIDTGCGFIGGMLGNLASRYPAKLDPQ